MHGTHIRIRTRTRTHLLPHTRSHTDVMCMFICSLTHIHTYAQAHTHSHKRAHTHTHTHTHKHTHTHTHTHWNIWIASISAVIVISKFWNRLQIYLWKAKKSWIFKKSVLFWNNSALSCCSQVDFPRFLVPIKTVCMPVVWLKPSCEPKQAPTPHPTWYVSRTHPCTSTLLYFGP